jgi:Zn-dependent M16 (insulinase) family peptidase
VVSKYLRTGYLWDTVRVMGGAYGGFCRLSPQSGVFTYLSYRDPNLKGTLDNYDNAAEHLLKLELSPADLSQAIIGAVGELDRPMQPDQKGFASLQQWLAGETADDRQARRDELLATTLADFRAFGDRLATLNKEGTVTVIGSKAAIEKANEGMAPHPKLSLRELI